MRTVSRIKSLVPAVAIGVAAIGTALMVGGSERATPTPSETDVLVAAYVNHQLPSWAQVEKVPNSVRKGLHLPPKEPAVMIIVSNGKWHGDDTVILTADGNVYES